MAKRTIRRRMRKNRTIRKVMRGCNRRRMKKGGAPPPGAPPPGAPPPQGTIPVKTYANQSPESVKTNAALTQQVAQSDALSKNQAPPMPTPIQSTTGPGISNNAANAPAAKGMQGGARTRYHRRRLRYKKSMARKSRRA
jgi:hypothetical protein